jgi:hypothetical protein
MVDLEKLCDYCGLEPATGYVKAYDSNVCEDCYENEHGGNL